MADALPDRARIVIIGGGVGGASVAYHLAERGERDVLLVERAELTSGSTFHSAGLVGQLRSDPVLTRMNVYSAQLYAELERTEHAPGWVPSGLAAAGVLAGPAGGDPPAGRLGAALRAAAGAALGRRGGRSCSR